MILCISTPYSSLSFFLSFLLHRRETNTRLLASLLYRSYRRLRHWTKKQIWRLCSTRSNRLDTTGELQWVLFKRGLSFPLLENFSFLFLLQCQQCRGCIYLECALDLLWPTSKHQKEASLFVCLPAKKIYTDPAHLTVCIQVTYNAITPKPFPALETRNKRKKSYHKDANEVSNVCPFQLISEYHDDWCWYSVLV